MKIKSISINKYKAFQRREDIDIESKNVFIYGENGSGKSSFYYAIKDFFQSSVEDIQMSNLRNIYLDDGEEDCSIDVEFNDSLSYSLNQNTKSTSIPLIADANRLKSFITYKHLLSVHNVKIQNKLDVFELIINGVLKHFKSNTITNGVELGQLWTDVVIESKKNIGLQKDFTNKNLKRAAVERRALLFNTALNRLFLDGNPDYLGPEINNVLSKLVPGLEIVLLRQNVQVTDRGDINQPKILLNLTHKGVSLVDKQPHFNLNEAKLSAIAISIFLGAILRQKPFSGEIKILFLDDILIGLDNENRLRLLDLLQDKNVPEGQELFKDFQIFITTYDRHWYEVAKVNLVEWKLLEFYRGDKGPVIIKNDKNTLEKAKSYFEAYDFPACANILRKELESLLKTKLLETYTVGDGIKGLVKPPTLDTLIDRLRFYFNDLGVDVPTELIDSLYLYKKILFNPMSHNDIESPIYKNDLQDAFKVLEELELIELPKRELKIDKGTLINLNLPAINYTAVLEVAKNVYAVSYDGNTTDSPFFFHFKEWSRNGVKYAEHLGANPSALTNEEILNNIKQKKFTVEKAILGLNSTFRDRQVAEINIMDFINSCATSIQLLNTILN